ncbi:MAG: hypothetical protein NXI04_11105 [Planctomycetaceae bacterium]|nr:hypothetical protein [Planctomycetaceae bacterium]
MTRKLLFAAVLTILPVVLSRCLSADERIVPDDLPQQRGDVPVIAAEVLTPAEWQQFAPVSPEQLDTLLKAFRQRSARRDSSVSRADYFARLQGRSLVNGRLTFRFPAATRFSELALGRTSLQRLTLFADDSIVPLALKNRAGLVPLLNSAPEAMTGTWQAEGVRRGRSTSFELTLPVAEFAVFELVTEGCVRVRSPNALVRLLDQSAGLLTWQLIPNDPLSVTIDCSAAADAGSDAAYVNLESEVRLYENDADISWSVVAPEVLAGSTLTMELHGDVELSSVRMAETDLPYRVASEKDQVRLEVTVPQTLTAAILVEGAFSSSAAGTFDVPFLKPTSFQSADRFQGALISRMPAIRVAIGPEDAIENLSLQGIYEQDVTFPSDGSQLLELQQYLADADLRIVVSDTSPLIEEDVLVRVDTQRNVVTADAFVRVAARSGTISRLSWEVPANWRVTDVRESEVNGPPLLFRVSSENPRQPTRLDVVLREPVSADDVARFLVVRMQSVQGAMASQPRPPGLTSARHDRLVDLVALPPGASASLVDSWTTGPLTPVQIQEQLPWIDDSLLSGSEVFNRGELSLEDLSQSRESQVRARVDYSVERVGRTLRQVAQVRIQSEDDLPAEILFNVGGDVIPQLEGATDSLSLRQVASAEVSSWVLSMNPEIASSRLAEFSLVVESEAAAATPGLVVTFPDCIPSGRIQPAADESVKLLMTADGRTETVTSAVEYPTSDFQLSLESRLPRAEATFVSGRGFLTVTRELSRVRAHVMCRCLVQPGGRSRLQFRALCEKVEVEVDGRHLFVDRVDDTFVVPLNPAAETVAVDIFLTRVFVQRSRIPMPVLRFDDAETQIDWFLLASGDDAVIQTESGAAVAPTRLSAGQAGRLMFDQDVRQRTSNTVRAFAGRWQVLSVADDACLLLNGDASRTSSQVVLKAPVSSWIRVSVAAVLVFVGWQLSGWFSSVRCACVLITLAALRVVLSSVLLDGLIAGTCLFVVYRAARFLLTRWVQQARRSIRLLPQSASLLMWLVLLPTAEAQVLTDPPDVFSVDRTGNSPVVYVRKGLLDRLTKTTQTDDRSVLVLETWADITLDESTSGSARIRALIAGRRDQSGTLPLPLENVTLVSCRVDGDLAFPRNDGAGNVSVETGVDSELPVRSLSDDPVVASAGPRTIGRYLLRQIEYEVRFSVKREAGEIRLVLPVPESPVTHVTLRDQADQIPSAQLIGAGAALPGDTQQPDGTLVFPELSNAARVELRCRVSAASSEPLPAREDADVTATVDVLADRMTITTEYRLATAAAAGERLQLNHSPEQVLSVRAGGNPVAWTALGDGISLAGDAVRDGEPIVVVRQEIATPLSLRKQLDLDQFRTINGRPVRRLTLVLRTGEQFIWREVLGDGKPLPTAPIPVDPELVRPMERRVIAARSVKQVSLEITERISTQLASVSQQAVVADDEIRWRCECESEISGQPAFRQVILLDSAVRVESVSATLSGSDRLQTWTRTNQGVVVSLREATRGNLQITMQGTIPRSLSRDTRLPIVEFPREVEVLQAVLDLSSAASSGAFVASFGGTRPDVPFNLTDQIPREPLRLSIIDDREPLVVRRAVPQQLNLEVVAMIYEAAGQLRVGTAVSVRAADVMAPLRFRIRGADLESQQPIVVRGQQRAQTSLADEAVLIAPAASADADQRTIVLLPNAIPVSRDGAVLIQTPEFDAPSVVTSVRCYDLRNRSPRRQNPIPRWVQERSSELNITTPSAGVQRLADFDDQSRRIQVRLPRQTSGTSASSAAADVLYVDCEHRIDATETGFRGASGFLVFSSQSRSRFMLPAVSGLNMVRVQANGQSCVTQIREGQLEVRLPTAVCHLVVDWIFTPAQTAGLQSYDVPFPDVPYQRGQHRIVISPSAQARGVRVKSPALLPELFLERRSTSIVEGLQGLSTDVPADTAPPQQENSSLPDTLWSQLSVRAPDAARSLDEFLGAAEADGSVLLSVSDSRVGVSLFHTPPLSAMLAFGSGVLLLVAFRFRSKAQQPVSASEQETVIRDRQAETSENSTQLTNSPDSAAR